MGQQLTFIELGSSYYHSVGEIIGSKYTGLAYIVDTTVKVLCVYVYPLISANLFIFSRSGVLTRRKKENFKSILHNQDTRM